MNTLYSKRHSARKMGLGLIPSTLVLCGILLLFARQLMDSTDFGSPGGIALIAIVSTVAALICGLGLYLIYVGGHFGCTLTDSNLTYDSPAKLFGDSFNVNINDIAKLTIVQKGRKHPSYKYFIHTSSEKIYTMSGVSQIDINKVFSLLASLRNIVIEEHVK